MTADESVEVAFPFTSTDPDQLQLVLGETIVIIKKTSTGWWIGRDAKGNVGSFPVNYTRPVKEKPKFAVTKEFKTAQLTTHSTTTSSGSTTPPPQQHSLDVGVGYQNQHTNGHNNYSNGTSSSSSHPLQGNAFGTTNIHVSGGGFGSAAAGTAYGSGAAYGNSNGNTTGGSGGVGGAFYRNMSRGDTQQLKELLGLDDDEDGGGDDDDNFGTPDRDGGGGDGRRHGSSSKKKKGNSPEHRRALETFLSNAFENTAGNHRSLNEGRPGQAGGSRRGTTVGSGQHDDGGMEGSVSMRSAGSLSSGWSPGAAHRTSRHVSSASSSQQLIEQVIALRKEIAKETSSYEKLHAKEMSMKRANDQDETVLDQLRSQVASVKLNVQKHQATVADYEKRIEALRYIAEHPEEGQEGVTTIYDPTELSRALQALESNSNTTAAAAVTQSSLTVTSPTTGVDETGNGNVTSSRVEIAAAGAVDEDPDDELIESEPAAKKLIRKLKKRIAEAEGTKEGYEKQLSKAKKRVGKFRASVQEVDEEIALLRRTLLLDGTDDDGATTTTAMGDNDITSSAANSEDEDTATSSPAGRNANGSGKRAKSEGSETKEQRIFRRLLTTLTEEEQADIERYQLAEVKLGQKAAKLREQLEGDSTEVSGLRSRIDKLKKLLVKGDQAMEELVHQRDEIQKQVNEVAPAAASATSEHAKAHAAHAKAMEALRSAQETRDGALAKRERDRETLLLRIEKERQRVADFENELTRLKEKAAAAAKSA